MYVCSWIKKEGVWEMYTHHNQHSLSSRLNTPRIDQNIRHTRYIQQLQEKRERERKKKTGYRLLFNPSKFLAQSRQRIQTSLSLLPVSHVNMQHVPEARKFAILPFLLPAAFPAMLRLAR